MARPGRAGHSPTGPVLPPPRGPTPPRRRLPRPPPRPPCRDPSSLPPPEWSAPAQYLWSPPPRPSAWAPVPEAPVDGSKKSWYSSTLGFVALVVGVMLVVGGLGTIGGYLAFRHRATTSNSASALPPAVTPTTPGSATTPADPSAAALDSLVLRQADVPSTVLVQPIDGGDQVSGQPTLDLCNGTFPSESLRTARLQVAAYDGQATTLLSTEAVLYKNTAATTQAFAELKSVAAKLPVDTGRQSGRGADCRHAFQCPARRCVGPDTDGDAAGIRLRQHRRERDHPALGGGLSAPRTGAHGRLLFPTRLTAGDRRRAELHREDRRGVRGSHRRPSCVGRQWLMRACGPAVRRFGGSAKSHGGHRTS